MPDDTMTMYEAVTRLIQENGLYALRPPKRLIVLGDRGALRRAEKPTVPAHFTAADVLATDWRILTEAELMAAAGNQQGTH